MPLNKLTQPLTFGPKEKKEILKLKGPIFVIGASGFIGANLFYDLSCYRDDIFACSIDIKKSDRLRFVPKDKLIELDVLDIGQLKKIFNRYKPLTVFNMSAFGAYSTQTDALKIHMTNYIGTLNLIIILQEIKKASLIQAGSSSEYGINCRKSNEKSELVPNSDYAASKVATSYLLKYYGLIKDFPCTHLRFFSIYGPWEEKTRLIPAIVRHGLSGTFPPFTKKNISRDYVFVEDCVMACVKAANNAAHQHSGNSYNVASGLKTTMEDMSKISKKVFGIKNSIKPIFGSMENRKWDLTDWYGNPKFAAEELGWVFNTNLETGLRLTANWQKNEEELINEKQ